MRNASRKTGEKGKEWNEVKERMRKREESDIVPCARRDEEISGIDFVGILGTI